MTLIVNMYAKLISFPGTCKILIQASGKYIEEHQDSNIRLTATPNDLRVAALDTIINCVRQERLGGYSTNQFHYLVDWITAPRTVFPGGLNIPVTTSFFTTAVTESHEWRAFEADPGSFDAETASQLKSRLSTAADAAPSGSVLQRDLQGRARYVRGSEEAIQSHGEGSGLAWWSGPEVDYPGVANFDADCATKSKLGIPVPGCNRTDLQGVENS